jgi:uncharacterized membrane protein YcgQ (UPF0703/DUF1980 family)
MRLRHVALAVAVAVALSGALAGCGAMFGATISGINARPDKYYQHKVAFTGKVQRMQFLPHETLLEIADTRGGRILVRCPEAVDVDTGDWVKVEGVLVPETKVEDIVVYDVVAAEKIDRTRAPRFVDLM